MPQESCEHRAHERGLVAGTAAAARPLSSRWSRPPPGAEHVAGRTRDSRAADMLYNIIGRRHEKRSTIITTNLAFKQWGAVFPGAACVVALVDRFAQHCHRLAIDADSWRENHGLDGSDPPPARPPSRRRRTRP